MPGKGKHRRPKSTVITRGIVAAGTGGAAIALPLIGATGAHAAEQAAPAAPTAAVAPAAAPAAAAEKSAGSATYIVVAGDHLSKIASERDVEGGWQALYADNRAAVGDDPSLIHPGLKLVLDGKGAERAPEAPAAKKAEAAEPAQTVEKGERASRDGARPAAPAPAAAEPAAPARQETAPAPAPEPAPEAASGSWAAPLAGAQVSTPYRASGAMWSSGYHTGVDFAVPTGTSVRSIGPGTVVSAGWAGAYGNEVVVQHTDGTYSQYAHLSSLSVSAGQSVDGGQQIGLSGSTGNSSGPHLHLEVRTGPAYGSDIDPVAHLRGHGVSL
ncbi:M23 family metallopeptidase [Streptomyces tsukubensis]|uniref:Peptidase n=2 Tax=Streptomyces TaxID=1883 RepID=A0A7G3U849_STRT9|nr:LysM peptidoglycan-binding domain-containing M23 family metallopeptidase [Streptomyces tsukubensis]AZK97559.1 peptidase [Streptomyces tsukubensis]QKM66496.1 peptidase [Streptomyces tsukubensis NRRL18488]TAI45165.1 peptidase [Streptomyces tsukubensis]